MDKQDIFVEVGQIEEQMGRAYEELGALKKKIIALLEENKHLMLENQQLRAVLQEKENKYIQRTSKEDVPVIGEGHDNLARLYNEGFHICNVYYGHLRTEGDCLFCLSFLNK